MVFIIIFLVGSHLHNYCWNPPILCVQDKLSQVKDARAALDALREEERERRRREAEEAERQRQIQLAKKLEVMRKKKAEYLEYQRQVSNNLCYT